MTPRPVRLPKSVQHELERCKTTSVVVAAVLTITNDEVDKYRALGLQLSGGQVITVPPAPPPCSCGTYACRNLDGWTDRRNDLPKEHRAVTSWAPSWNSGSFHLGSRQTVAYPLEHHPAKLLTISATVGIGVKPLHASCDGAPSVQRTYIKVLGMQVKYGRCTFAMVSGDRSAPQSRLIFQVLKMLAD